MREKARQPQQTEQLTAVVHVKRSRSREKMWARSTQLCSLVIASVLSRVEAWLF